MGDEVHVTLPFACSSLSSLLPFPYRVYISAFQSSIHSGFSLSIYHEDDLVHFSEVHQTCDAAVERACQFAQYITEREEKRHRSISL